MTQTPQPEGPLTPEEEWAIINTDSFDKDCRVKINAILSDLDKNQATPSPAIETNVNGVYVKFHQEGNFINVDCGKTSQGEPQVSIKVPRVWLES